MPTGRSDPATTRVLAPAILLYVGSSTWLAAAQYGPFWATVPIIAGMAAFALFALWAASAAPGGTTLRWWCMTIPFAVYAGWISCATFVNIAEVAPGYGWDRFGLTRDSYAIVSLALAVLLSVGFLWVTRGNPVFAATVVCALAAMIVACRTRGLPDSIAIACLTGIAIVAASAWWLRERLPAMV